MEIEVDVNYRIQAGCVKWRSVLGVVFDQKVLLNLMGKFYRIVDLQCFMVLDIEH